MQFEEQVSVYLVKYLYTLTLEKYIELITKEDEIKIKTKAEREGEYQYHLKFCRDLIKCGGVITRLYSQKDNRGRFYCHESIQMRPSAIRGYLMAGISTDIDMCACHATILLYICKQNKIACPYLEYYINHRKEMIKESPAIKHDVLEIINASNKARTDGFLANFKKECGAIRAALFKLNKYEGHLVACKGKKNEHGSTIFMVMEDLEVEIIRKVLDFLSNKKIKTAVLIHDGVMAYGDYYSDRGLLDELESFIEGEFAGLGMKFAYKDHSTKIKTPESFNADDVVVKDDEKSYEYMKKEFERTHFKVCEKGLFGKEKEDEALFFSPEGLNASYEHMQCLVESFDKNGKPVKVKKQFIGLWRADPNIRIYRTIDCNPNTAKCPPDVFNTWTPFAMEGVDYVEDKEGLGVVLNHIKIICNNDEDSFEYFCKWIGQMIMHPETKTICPTFISEEGAGKGALVDLLRAMLGEKKIFQTTTPSRDVWGSFNGRMASCFLVILNEISKKDSEDSEGRIKGLITDSALTINPKGVGQYDIQSCHRFMASTNNAQFMTIKHGNRRHFVVRSSDEKIGDKGYFDNFYELLSDVNVVKTCYEYFKNLPGLDKFGSLAVPVSEHQLILQDSSVSPIELWIKSVVVDADKEVVEIPGKEAFAEFQCFLTEGMFKNYEVNSLQFATRLSLLKINGLTHTLKGKQRLTTRVFDVKKIKAHFKIVDPEEPECLF